MNAKKLKISKVCLLLTVGWQAMPAAMTYEEFIANHYTTYTVEPVPTRSTTFNAQIAAYIEEDETNPPPEGGIVGVGSSSMVRWACAPGIQAEFETGGQQRRLCWPGRIYDDLEGLTVIPRGFGGAHFTDIMYFAEELIFPYNPRAVMVYAGDSDTQGGKSAERVRDDLVSFVFYCRQNLPNLRIYVISIKPSIYAQSVWPVASAANGLMKAYCDATEGVTFIDVASGMFTSQSQSQLRSGIFIYDQLHLSEAGYDIWADAAVPVMLEHEAQYEADVSWNGYPINNGYVDTGDWLGQLYVENAPWVYSFQLEGWIMDAELTSTIVQGEWFYRPN